MSTEQNKILARRWWESLNQGNALEMVDEVYAAGYVLHDPSLPEPVQGLKGVREFISSVLVGFPDARFTIENLIAEGDKVVQHISVQATHQGEFMGIPPTGKQVTISAMVISRVAHNKIAEEWQLFDALGMMQQMGVIPAGDEGGG